MIDDRSPIEPSIEPFPAARRRLGLVATLYAYRALAGLVITLPAVASIGIATSHYPRRQAELFDDGGVMLLESLRLSRRALPAVLWSGGAITILAAAVGLLPLAALITGLGRSGRVSGAFLLARAWSHAGTLALIFGLGLAMQIVVSSILLLLGGKLIDVTRLVPPREDFAFLALLTLIFALVSVIGVLRDLAYVAAVHGNHGLYDATARALRTWISRPLRSTFAWAWRAAVGLACLAIAAWLAPPARDATTAAIALGFVLHQAALAASAFTRASWLAAAMRTLAPR